MSELEFETKEINPLTQLSGLRLEIGQTGDDFELFCRLLFGRMDYEHKGRIFEVSINRAYLQLTPEGCETKLGYTYGEDRLPEVSEDDYLQTNASAEIAGSLSSSPIIPIDVRVEANAEASTERRKQRSQNKRLLPVSARPNDGWEIRPVSVNGAVPDDTMLEGTAIPDALICRLRKKQGGNRMAILGEVHVAKRSVKVNAKGGNRIGKNLSVWQNKEAIVSQILKLAVQREASTNNLTKSPSTVAISRYEIGEK